MKLKVYCCRSFILSCLEGYRPSSCFKMALRSSSQMRHQLPLRTSKIQILSPPIWKQFLGHRLSTYHTYSQSSMLLSHGDSHSLELDESSGSDYYPTAVANQSVLRWLFVQIWVAAKHALESWKNTRITMIIFHLYQFQVDTGLLFDRYCGVRVEMKSRKDYRYKPKDEEHKTRFGFEYNRANINYRTQIPSLPEKPRAKPDEKVKDKKVEEVQLKIANAKQARIKKKGEIKQATQAYDERIQEVKKKVELASKCIAVLDGDLDDIYYEINKVKGKISKKLNLLDENIAAIRKLKDQGRPERKRGGKKLEEMTLRELQDQRLRIEHQMSVLTLSKAEELQLNAQLTRIGRLRADPSQLPTEQPLTDNSAALSVLTSEGDALRAELQRLKSQKSKLLSERDEVDWKIQCIREDTQQFIADIKAIAAEQEKDEKVAALYADKDALKQQIYDLRQEVAEIQKAFAEKTQEYEYEQEKIRWISWATKVQEEKREEWEAEKAERKRQKLREKEKGEKGKEEEKGKEGEKTEGAAKEKEKEERRRPNRNQKEIDNCAFLIDYCRRLYPSSTNTSQPQKRQVNLEAELKKGAWAKEKGVQIIQSKKARKDEEDEQPSRPRKQQGEKEEEAPVAKKFNHDYFIQKAFDGAKVIPPTSEEQLDKIIKELEDKVEYYLLHPDEGVDSKFDQDRKFIDKNTKVENRDYKYTKSKGNSKVINSEDFPALA